MSGSASLAGAELAAIGESPGGSVDGRPSMGPTDAS